MLLPLRQTPGGLWLYVGRGNDDGLALGALINTLDKQGSERAGGPGVAYPGNLNGGPVVELGGNPAQNYTGPGTYVVRSGTFSSANLGGLLARSPHNLGFCWFFGGDRIKLKVLML